MIDLKVLREDPDRVRASQRARGEDVARRRPALPTSGAGAGVRFDELAPSRSRSASSSQGHRRGEGRAAEAGQQLAADVKAADAERDAADAEAASCSLQLGNIVEPDVPVGGEEDFVTLEEDGKPRDFAAEGFEPRDHLELGGILGAIDVERGAKVSGSRFYYLTGVGALLELALVNAAMARPPGGASPRC